MAHTSLPSSAPLLLAKHDEHDTTIDAPYTYIYHRRRDRSRRTPIGTFLCVVTALGLFAAVLTLFWVRGQDVVPLHATPEDIQAGHEPVLQDDSEPEPEPEPEPSVEELWNAQALHWVNGEPTPNFQDNLRPDTQYVTTWVSGGWTNDFMTYINMIYLGLLTSRTPVIPPFAPSHVAYDAGFPPFGDVFNVPRLAAAINAPLLEWRDVKRENSSDLDQLGCWTIWGLVGSDNGKPRNSLIPQRLNLDVAYTALPPSSPRIANLWLPFWTLAKLGFPSRREQALTEHPPQTPAPHSGVHVPPDEHLLCFDFMYYVGAADHDEWWYEWSPAWRLVGQYARWEPKLERLALGFVQRALGLDEAGDAFPPYIAVHIRRGDFTAACGRVPADICFQPLSAYARRVADVAATLHLRGTAIPVHHVLVTSDETDAAWWDEVAAHGWHRVDHAREATEARLGRWYPPLVDAVVQSMAVGFVGTDRSTMSMVAKRRVESWHGGVGELVRIGGKDADAH